MKKYDLICTGLTFCDMVFQGLGRVPQPGEEIGCEAFAIHVGGAANTPMAASKLGLRVAFVSAVGQDDPGALVIAQMKRMGLDAAFVRQDADVRTCVTAVLSVGGDRGFASYFAEQKYDRLLEGLEAAASQTKHLHASLLDLMELPLVSLAQKHGCTLSVDAAFAEAIPENLSRLRGVDVFFLNRDEMQRMTGEREPLRALEVLRTYVGHIVLKLGDEGSLCLRDGQIIRQAAYPVGKVVDTTGAGDCFCAGYLFALDRGMSAADCLCYANAAGSVNVRFVGGMDERMSEQAVRNVISGREPF